MSSRYRLLVALTTTTFLCGCKQYVPMVLPPEDVSSVDPDDDRCTQKDVVAFVNGHLEDLDGCARHLVCEKGQARTVTLVVGCDGPLGSLSVMSAKDMGDYNDCVMGRAESWDFGTICVDGDPSGCAWSIPVDIECRGK